MSGDVEHFCKVSTNAPGVLWALKELKGSIHIFRRIFWEFEWFGSYM